MSFIGKRIKAFSYAFSGIGQALKKEDAFKVHLVAAILVIAASFYFGISKTEWIIICFCIALVFAAELFNSAIEKLCDLYSSEKNQYIKYIKDVSAGAVLVTVIGSVIAGAVIFWPHVLRLF